MSSLVRTKDSHESLEFVAPAKLTRQFGGWVVPDDLAQKFRGLVGFDKLAQKTLSLIQATDPRDKVYALLNLAFDGKEIGFLPDYSEIGQKCTSKRP